MKRIFTLISLFALIAVLASCAKQQQVQATCDANETFKVGLVTDTGGIDDKSFNQGTWEGVVRFAKAYDLCKDNYKYLQSDTEADYIPNLTTFAEQNLNLIVAPGFLFETALSTVATNKPNQNFLIIDMVVPKANVASAVFAEHEGSYLVGVAAALKAKADNKNKVGFLGGAEFDLIWKFEAGYTAGVKSVDPNITVLVEYATGFDKTEEGQAKAAKMYDEGAYIIYHAAGSTGNGAIKEAKDRAQRATPDIRWVIGVDKDQYADGIYADNKSVILTSMMKRVDIAAETVARQTYEGYFPGNQVLVFTLANDGVGIPGKNPNLTNDIITKIKEARVNIINGTIIVPVTNEAIIARNQ